MLINRGTRRFSAVAAICGLAAVSGAGAQDARAAVVQPDTEAVAKVTAGTVKEAKASWWGFNAEDATVALQAAIDSKVPKLTVDNVGRPWVVTPLHLVSNQEIVFEEGVELLAKAGEFASPSAALVSASQVENIILRGYKATFRMRRSDYDDPARYKKAEWRHCLSIRSCRNIKVYGLTLAESGGDGIYLGTSAQWVTNKDIHIKDVICDRNYRQGISVITAENLLIENTVMRDTAGTAPQAGIDFEPNHPQERLVNCVMRDCVSEGNQGSGYVLYVRPLDSTSVPMSMRFENCRAAGNGGTAFGLITGDSLEKAVDGTVDLVNCVLESGKAPCVTLAKPADRCRLTLTNCQLLDTPPDSPQPAPIVISSGQDTDQPVGGMALAKCVVRDGLDRPPMAYIDRGGGIPLKGVTGTVVIEKAGQRTDVELTDAILGKWLPVTKLKSYPRLTAAGVALRPQGPTNPAANAFGFARVRQVGRFLLYATKGDAVTFRVSHQQVGKYAGKPAPVIVLAPSGTEAKRADAPFQAETDVSFTAGETGVYRVRIDAQQNQLAVTASSHPLNLVGEGAAIRLIGSAGNYSFFVPKGTREFGVRVAGEGTGEAIRAALVDPAGKVVQDVDNVVQTHQFEVGLPAPSAQGETWCLRLSKPTAVTWEDHYVDLRGILPILAPSREALLVPAE